MIKSITRKLSRIFSKREDSRPARFHSVDHQSKMAIQSQQTSLDDAKQNEDELQVAQKHLGLAEKCKSENDIKEAIQRYQDSLAIAKKQGHKEMEESSIRELSKLTDTEDLNHLTEKTASPSRVPETIVSWNERSIFHREKLKNLCEYAKTNPEEIRVVNGVYVCCSEEFLIGQGSQGTCVYVGLGTDGVEKAVKRLVRNTSSSLAKQEMKILSELNTKSKHVINYWFLEEQCDKDFLYLILDLCEETLENFVKRSSQTDLVRCAPDIIRQVLKGLADLHRDPNPILQRDLKPSNILRNIQDNWLLADFGISRILKEGMTTHLSSSRGTEDWKAVESCSSKGGADDSNVRYKKESDIQVIGMVAFYILTKGKHPFGGKPDRLRNLLDDKPVGLDNLKDDAAKDLISWMLNHDPKDRPSAKEALKHPYLQPAKQQFEMLCKIGNQPEIKTQDVKSDVVRKLNSNPEDWRSKIPADDLTYLFTVCLEGRPVSYEPSFTRLLQLMRNVEQHWHDRPRPRPEVFYIVDNPQKYFLNLFPSLCVEVHKIIRSCDWKQRDDLKEYFH